MIALMTLDESPLIHPGIPAPCNKRVKYHFWPKASEKKKKTRAEFLG